MSDYDVIVIGAGCGGVTSGALLAAGGRSVLVLEQSDLLGGCCSTFEKDGYYFDVGATLLEFPLPIDHVFRSLGTTFADEVDLVDVDPVYNVVFDDGSRLLFPQSPEGTGEVISELSAEDGRSWPRFAAMFEDFLDKALSGFFMKPAGTMGDMMRMMVETPGLMKFGPLFVKSYKDVIEKYFKNNKVQQSMAYQSFYSGLPPSLAPALLSFLAYSEHQGLFYPRGGMIAVPAAIARCGEKAGMKVELKKRVDRVLVSGGRARGVRLADGTEITSDIVISDINAKALYLDLVGEENLHPLARAGIKSYTLSVSAPVIYAGVDYEPPLGAHHTLVTVPMEDLDDYWYNQYQKGMLPEKLFGLICCGTVSDPGLAPEGHHVLNIILGGPYHLSGSDWDTEKQALGERVIEQLSRSAIPGLAEHVQTIEVATPLDFERRLLMPEGAFLALEMNLLSLTAFRPSAKSRSVKGLYLAGASTHPGGGVPTTIASGIIAADLIDRQER
jgi:phytoene desaturase